MRRRLLYIVGVLLLETICPVTPQEWLMNFDQTENMKSFFEEQRVRVEKAINSGYESAKKMRESVNSYVEEQHKKISDDINKYVENVKDNGKKAMDAWSYLPGDDTASRLDNPDVVLSVPGIIKKYGYICETHTVTSQGYVLNVHRIPRPKGSEYPDASRKTVYLQHGLFASSADWIINGPEKSLAFVLADAGYDVWMGNIRGNKYSREHLWLKTNSKPYWNFSWHDVAEHDVPAIIDYISGIKGSHSKVTYIGHSMGTTILFAMLSLRPEYNTKLSAGFALAPVVFMSNLKSPLKALAPITSNVAYMEMLYGSHEFIPKQSSLGKISSSCEVDKMDFMVCKNIIFYICGYDEKQFNKTLLPVFLSHLGTGTSWKTAVHFAQEIVSGGNFQKFDYGSRNREVYGTDTPPLYDLTNISLPIKLFWAENDLLSSEKDVQTLFDKLPPSAKMYKVPFKEFNHLDYLWAVDAPTLLNDEILHSLASLDTNEKNILFNLRFGK